PTSRVRCSTSKGPDGSASLGSCPMRNVSTRGSSIVAVTIAALSRIASAALRALWRATARRADPTAPSADLSMPRGHLLSCIQRSIPYPRCLDGRGRRGARNAPDARGSAAASGRRLSSFPPALAAAVEVAYLDCVGKSVNHLCQFGCLGGCECAPRNRRGDRLHCGREIGRLAHRRERERHQPLTMRRDQAVETEPQCGRVAAESELDGLAGQGLGLALKQQLSGLRRAIAIPARAARRIAGTPLLERAPPLFLLFLQEIISSH